MTSELKILSIWLYRILLFFSVYRNVRSTSIKQKLTLFTDTQTWNDAKLICENSGMTLLQITSRAKSITVDRYIADWGTSITTDLWIGLHEVNKQIPELVKWLDCNNTDSYSDFATSHPLTTADDMYCYALTAIGLNWKSNRCDTPLQFICEKDIGLCDFDRFILDTGCSLADKESTDVTITPCQDLCLNGVWTDAKECWAIGFWDGYSGDDCWMFYSFDPDACFSNKYAINPIVLYFKTCYKANMNTTSFSIISDAYLYPRSTCFVLPTTTSDSATTTIVVTSQGTTTPADTTFIETSIDTTVSTKETTKSTTVTSESILDTTAATSEKTTISQDSTAPFSESTNFSEETTEVLSTETTRAMSSAETTETLSSQDTTETLSSQGTTETLSSQGTTESLSSQGTTETLSSQGTTDTLSSQGTTETLSSQGTTETLSSQGTTETLSSQGTTETLSSQGTTETLSSQGTTETLSSQGTTETLSSQGTTETLSSQGTTEVLAQGTTGQLQQGTTENNIAYSSQETTSPQDTTMGNLQTSGQETMSLGNNIYNDSYCKDLCKCEEKTLISSEEMDNIIASLVVDVKKTSNYKRRYYSPKDERMSAKSIGYVGLVFLCIAFGGIVVFDINVLFQHLKSSIKRFQGSANYTVYKTKRRKSSSV